MDYYKTLNVPKDASLDDIKASYKKLAKKYHPDMNGGDADKFKQISEAYETLSNPDKRREYDLLNSNMGGPDVRFYRNGNSDHIMEEMFRQQMNEVFGHGFGSTHGFSPGHRRYKNRDLNVHLTINLEDLAKTEKKRITVKKPSGGSEILELDIPAHIESGDSLRYAGLGDDTNSSLQRGDLYVIIHINPHKTFQKKGLDLFTKINVSCFEAVLGTKKQVKSLDGKNLEVKVPKGTQPGTILNIKDYGLKSNSVSGNLLVQINVFIPSGLSSEQEKIIENNLMEK